MDFLQILYDRPISRGFVESSFSSRHDLNAVAAGQRIPEVVPPTVVVKATYQAPIPKCIAEPCRLVGRTD